MRVDFPSRILARHVGGNTTYTRRLASGLRKRDHEVGLMPSSSNAAITAAHETIAALRRSRADVLHYSADTGPLLASRTPSVVTVHGVASRSVKGIRSPISESIWRARVGRAISSTDALVSVSRSSAADISAVFGIEESRIHVVPHGIDVHRFERATAMSDPIRKLVPERFALYLGNIEPRKNLVQLARAFNSQTVRALELPLVVAGRPAWNHDEAMREIEASDQILYLGFVSDSDRVALMQQCSVFVFPSLYEGFGFPVLEAMAAGAPVITSRRGSLAEVAGPAAEFSELDADGIADSIVSTMTDQRWLQDTPTIGRGWARKFDWDKSIETHIEIYEGLLPGQYPRR